MMVYYIQIYVKSQTKLDSFLYAYFISAKGSEELAVLVK